MPDFPERYYKKDINSFNMAGIIVISGQQQPDFKFPVHPCLFPVSENYSLIDNAIIECAALGCSSIWIVSDRSIEPLLKYKIKNFVIDPMRSIVSHEQMQYMDIEPKRPNQFYLPVYYIPVKPEDIDKRDSLSYNAMTAAEHAIQIGKSLSRYTIPDAFYVCSPYKIYDIWSFSQIKAKIANSNTNFCIRYDDKTYRNGLYTGFTFQPRDMGSIRQDVFKKSTGLYDMSEPYVETIKGVQPFRSNKKLPPEDRYSARFFTPGEVFNMIDQERSTIYFDIEEYYEIFSFEDYQNYCASGFKVTRPQSYRNQK